MVNMDPGLIILNGNVWTMNEHMPAAEALAVYGKDILAIGSAMV